MSPRQVLSRPRGVVPFAEGKTHASGSVAPLCCRHSRIFSRVVDDKATFRIERSLLGRSSFPRYSPPSAAFREWTDWLLLNRGPRSVVTAALSSQVSKGSLIERTSHGKQQG